MESDSSRTPNASRIFEGYKALGRISDDKPFLVRYIQKLEEVRIVSIVGRYFHTYNSKLQLIEASHPHPGSVNAIASDSKSVYSCSENKIYAWKGGHRHLRQVFDAHESRVHSILSFGLHLISVDDDNILKVWEIATKEIILDMPFGDGFTITRMLHPSTYVNKILLGSKQGALKLLNVRTQKFVHTFKGWSTGVVSLEQAPAVDVVGIGLDDGVIVVHNLRYDETLMTFIQDWGPVIGISFRTDGIPHMTTSSDKGHLAIWDLEKRKLLVQKRDVHQAAVTGCQYILKEALMITSSPDNSIKIWCFDDPDQIGRVLFERVGHSSPSNFIRFHGSEGRNILSVAPDSTVRMFSVLTERLHRSLGKASYNRKHAKKFGSTKDPNVMPPIIEFAVEYMHEEDWDNVVARHSGLAIATTWTTKRMKMGHHKLLHERFKHNKKAIILTALTVSSCGNFVILGYNTGHLDRFNIQSGIHRATYGEDKGKAHNGPVSGVICDETCRLLVSGGADGRVIFWIFKNATRLTELSFNIPISRFELHKESSLLAVAFEDNTIQMIDLDTRKCIRKFPDHKTTITDMAFSFDARWLIVATTDASIRVWDVSLIKLIDWFLMPSPCKSLSMSPTGDHLAMALEGEIGIFLYFNLSLYLPVSLKPISDSYVPRLNELPSVRKDEPENEDKDEEKDGDEDVIDNEDISDQDTEMIDLDYQSPEQISDQLITLSNLPASRWKNLLNLDIIRQRNKPTEPIEKPKSAPFFLPTVDGLEPEFDLNVTEDLIKSESKSRVLANNLLGVSPFGKLLINCATKNDYTPIIKQLKEMSPIAIDTELKSLDVMISKTDEIEADDHLLLAYFLQAMESGIETKRNYELIQSILGLFLKTYTSIILKDPNLVQRCDNLCKRLRELPNSLQDQFNESLYIINFIRGAV